MLQHHDHHCSCSESTSLDAAGCPIAGFVKGNTSNGESHGLRKTSKVFTDLQKLLIRFPEHWIQAVEQARDLVNHDSRRFLGRCSY